MCSPKCDSGHQRVFQHVTGKTRVLSEHDLRTRPVRRPAGYKPLLELAPDAMDALLIYDWPGNVRELRTAIEHGVVMATGKQIRLRDLPMALRQAATAKLPGGVSPTEAFGEKTSPLDLHETERRLIAQALAATNGNITAAAKKLGISRRTLHRKINEMNLAKKSTEAVAGGVDKRPS